MHRRAAVAVTATAGGLALLLNFKTPSAPATPAGATAPATTSGGSAATAGSGSGSGSQTVTGPAEWVGWGNVQVEVTVDGGRITNVAMVQVPGSHRRSVEINDRAVPILIDETLSAQSANIDMVSGATDTSGGYIASLQAALDEAGR